MNKENRKTERNFFVRRLNNLPVKKKLGLLTVTFLIAIISLVFLSNFAMNLLSGIRAYVGAEGLWSKGQKDAAYYLRKYASSHNEVDYQKYLEGIKIPLADKKVRLELIKKDGFNRDIAYEGFKEGKIQPEDVEIMIYLVRTFKGKIKYIDEAIDTWEKGDEVIAKLVSTGDELRQIISSGQGSQERIEQILSQVDINNEELTVLEDKFSYTLGEASRWLKGFLFKIMFGISGLIIVGGVVIFLLILRHLIKGIYSIRSAASRGQNANIS